MNKVDYVSANGDMLINFRKIKYASGVRNAKKTAENTEAAKRREVAARNAEKRTAEITPALSRGKSAVRESSVVKMRTQNRTYAQPSVRVNTQNVRTRTAAAHTAKAVTAKPVTAEDVRTAAAEFLSYSCEEKAYTETAKAAKTARFPIAFFATAAVVTLLFIMLIGAYSQLSEALAEKESLENSINACLSTKDELEMRISEKLSLDEIENIAVNRLGMVKAEGANVGYISIAGEDKIVVADTKEQTGENMSIVMSSVGRLLDNLIHKNR